MKPEKIKLVVRQARHADIPGIAALSSRIYGDMALTEEMLAGQQAAFPEGQFVAEYNNEIVGSASTFMIGEIALQRHTWSQITGHGFASRHDPDGDYLYGLDVCVDEHYRGLRIGQRLYDARKALCRELHLKGIVFGGRMPNLARKVKKAGSAEAYIGQVLEGNLKDPVINFQLRNDFEFIGLLPNYLPKDKNSLGYATHMLWTNPVIEDRATRATSPHVRLLHSVRVASVQYQVRKVKSFEDFAKQVEYFIDVAADYRADFVLFPELFTIPLLSIDTEKHTPQQAIERITEYTQVYVDMMQKLSVSYNVNIIGGSHPTRVADGTVENHAFVFLRDGQVHVQSKIHPTPNERYWWNIKGGEKLKAIQTDCGPIGVLICYDSEFPELARYLTDQGIKILFVPYCTDERQGHLRVRYCCQARAIENQIYVATAGICGNLPDIANMDVHYAESGIFTPCDFPFARDGIAAQADANTEAIIIADLNIDQLVISRNTGTVQNLKDRRFDLYGLNWNDTPGKR